MHQIISQSTSTTTEVRHGYDAAREAAEAAWAAAFASGCGLVLTLLGVLLSGLIAWVAISSPNRERLTRDCEIRKARKRLDGRTADAGTKALSTVRAVERYVSTRNGLSKTIDPDVVDRYVSRLEVRGKAMAHYLDLEIRDPQLVADILEVGGMLEMVRAKICRSYWVGRGQFKAFEDATVYLSFKSKRRQVLQKHFADKKALTELRDQQLQGDIDRIWSLRWFWPFNRKMLVQTPRD